MRDSEQRLRAAATEAERITHAQLLKTTQRGVDSGRPASVTRGALRLHILSKLDAALASRGLRVGGGHLLVALLSAAIASHLLRSGGGVAQPALPWTLLPVVAAAALLGMRACWFWLAANALVAVAVWATPVDPNWIPPAAESVLFGRLSLLAGVGVILALQARGADDNVARLREAVASENAARTSAQLLHETTAIANSSATAKDALADCVEKLCAAQGWEAGHFFVTDPRTGSLVSGRSWRFDTARHLAGLEAAQASPMARDWPSALAVSRRQPAWLSAESSHGDLPEWRARHGVGTAVAVPVFGGGGVAATFELFSSEARPLEPETLESLQNVAAQVGHLIERTSAEERIRKLAYFDTLTGLPNRQHFLGKLERALRSAQTQGRRVALLMLDLDRFKYVNESLGHSLGDRLLTLVGERLTQGVRWNDLVGRPSELLISRLGGDEFTVLIADLPDAHDAARVAERLLDSLAEPIRIGRQDVFLAASVGIATYPDDAGNSETLLRCAGGALYAAKRAGSSAYRFYTPGLDSAASARLALEARLRRAIEQHELTVHFQPVRDARSSEVVSVEALARWYDGERWVPPDEFIPIAEDAGLIGRLGELVLRSSCIAAASWRERGAAPVRVAVNFSGRQFRLPDLSDTVRAILAETGHGAGQLEIEITESTILQDDEVTLGNLEALRALGVSIALDDFGTGHASVGNLRRFPVDRLKMDKSFVHGLAESTDDRALAQGIIALAHSLRLEVIAEGVETEAQAALLREFGCDQLQGWLLGRPAPADEVERLLPREKADAASA